MLWPLNLSFLVCLCILQSVICLRIHTLYSCNLVIDFSWKLPKMKIPARYCFHINDQYIDSGNTVLYRLHKLRNAGIVLPYAEVPLWPCW